MSDPNERDTAHYRRLVVDHVTSMLAYWDRGLRCRFANRAYLTWFGVAPERLIGMTIQELLGPELFALNEPHIRAALRGEEQLFERIVPGPGGTRRHGLAHYIPDVADGEVRGFLVQVTDLSQLKETEQALQREQTLRAQVERDAQALQRLLQERNDILDVLAHEVRQPLHDAAAALRGVEVALQELGDRVGPRLARAHGVVAQVLAKIDNTLAAAALIAGIEGIERQDGDIDTLVATAIADVPPSERGRIRVLRETATRTASMDATLMRLALRNLLTNALKYSPPGSPVTVRLTDSDAPLALLIDVADAGEGIEAALLPRLFERGARGEHADRRSSYGLGLHLVRRVMDLHGGRVLLLRNGTDGATLRLVLDQSVPA